MLAIIIFLFSYYFFGFTIYYFYGLSYANGSAQYAMENNNGSTESEDPWKSVMDELAEFIESIKKCNIKDIFLEFFDVLHSIVKFIIVIFFPTTFYFSPLCWLIIFPFVMPAGIKLGHRYQKYGCIRNHARPNLNHCCHLNNKLMN